MISKFPRIAFYLREEILIIDFHQLLPIKSVMNYALRFEEVCE